MTDFDPAKLAEYRKIFGSEKMKSMWLIFSDETEKCLTEIAQLSEAELRLKFHNLRSAALVFGMERFSDCCSRVEEAVINGVQSSELAKEFEEAKMIFNQQRQDICAILK